MRTEQRRHPGDPRPERHPRTHEDEDRQHQHGRVAVRVMLTWMLMNSIRPPPRRMMPSTNPPTHMIAKSIRGAASRARRAPRRAPPSRPSTPPRRPPSSDSRRRSTDRTETRRQPSRRQRRLVRGRTLAHALERERERRQRRRLNQAEVPHASRRHVRREPEKQPAYPGRGRVARQRARKNTNAAKAEITPLAISSRLNVATVPMSGNNGNAITLASDV